MYVYVYVYTSMHHIYLCILNVRIRVPEKDALITHLEVGSKKRASLQTAMNIESSRSHSIIQLEISNPRNPHYIVLYEKIVVMWCPRDLMRYFVVHPGLRSTLFLVDLAGSERTLVSETSGATQRVFLLFLRGYLCIGGKHDQQVADKSWSCNKVFV